jgi:hypothetical protein
MNAPDHCTSTLNSGFFPTEKPNPRLLDLQDFLARRAALTRLGTILSLRCPLDVHVGQWP